MITQAKIDNIFGVQIAAGISLKFRLANQKGKKPARPYATYNAIVEDVDSPHQNYREVAINQNDGSYADVSNWEASRATVSLRFIGDKNSHIDTLRQKANDVINWIRRNRVDDVALRVISPKVQDLTDFVEQNYEYVLALDVRVDSCEEHVAKIEAIERVEATPTEDGIVLPPIIADQNN